MRTITATLIVLVAGTTATACASSGDAYSEGPDPRAETYLEVTNNNWLDVAVYVMRGTTRSRLGTVFSMTTQRFRLPRSAMAADGQIRLMASPIGSREIFDTPAILVEEGSRISWQVENQLSLSSYAVR